MNAPVQHAVQTYRTRTFARPNVRTKPASVVTPAPAEVRAEYERRGIVGPDDDDDLTADELADLDDGRIEAMAKLNELAALLPTEQAREQLEQLRAALHASWDFADDLVLKEREGS